MSKNIFILGAGASKEAGAPLMDDFLDKAKDLLDLNKVKGKYKKDFDRIFKTISDLKPIHYAVKIDLDNIENLFAALEMGKLLDKIPNISEEESESLLKTIKLFIFITLEKTIEFPVHSEKVYPNENYEALVKLMKELNESGLPQNKCSVITFNYDLALDYALNYYNSSVNYGLSEIKNQRSPLLLKLHGSSNWVKCQVCGKISFWSLSEFFGKYQYLFLKNLKFVNLDLASKLISSGLKCCDKEIKSEPYIVPPTWSKTEYYKDISLIWKRAAFELSEAENIFICGYSLRESDLFFRYLFGLSSIGASRIRRFWVFDPDESDIVYNRFINFIAPAIEKKFRFEKKRFSEAINIIRNELIKNDY